jgi:hypothetical protein
MDRSLPLSGLKFDALLVAHSLISRFHCSRTSLLTVKSAEGLCSHSPFYPGEMSEHLFEDTFVVNRLDPDGKKFDRGKFFLSEI